MAVQTAQGLLEEVGPWVSDVRQSPYLVEQACGHVRHTPPYPWHNPIMSLPYPCHNPTLPLHTCSLLGHWF